MEIGGRGQGEGGEETTRAEREGGECTCIWFAQMAKGVNLPLSTLAEAWRMRAFTEGEFVQRL